MAKKAAAKKTGAAAIKTVEDKKPSFASVCREINKTTGLTGTELAKKAAAQLGIEFEASMASGASQAIKSATGGKGKKGKKRAVEAGNGASAIELIAAGRKFLSAAGTAEEAHAIIKALG